MRWVCLLAALGWNMLSTSAWAKVEAYTGKIQLPTYPWGAVQHPYFRGTDKVNIYPYPMLDFLSRERTNRTYRTVILENEYLRITFLPELGGKIQEVLDKSTRQSMFYVNHVVKPGLIGQCGAWTSGGVEWNTGPQGHTVSCMLPVDVRILPAEKDGARSVAIGETERIYGTKWTVVVTLRPGRSFIEERIRIYNPTESVRPYYFWNCTASPNTLGFRFIYPMTLGMDHSGDKFFHWPIDEGRDLRYGTNYQDAASIFAFGCDQDFFGSYNDDLDRGVVSVANHHQLPGKKAWTWGRGGYGTMHQADLTDTDGPYNEVQTGPLLTQGEVGRLEPCEAVEWKEWWYPIHGMGGFTFANRNVALNARVEKEKLHLQMLGSGTWRSATVAVVKQNQLLVEQPCTVEPKAPTVMSLPLNTIDPPFEVVLQEHGQIIAKFALPQTFPERQVPEKRPSPKTSSEWVQAGWQEYLFARFSDAENRFRKALESDPNCRDAHLGLAQLFSDQNETATIESARKALAVDPDCGQAHYLLALAESRLGHQVAALEEAWKATLDPASAIGARALVAKLSLQQKHFDAAIDTLSEPGPWQDDPLCQDRLALAFHLTGQPERSLNTAKRSLEVDPLDDFAHSVIWLVGPAKERRALEPMLGGNLPSLIELAARYFEAGCSEQGYALLDKFYVGWPHIFRNPVLDEWYLGLAPSRSSARQALAALHTSAKIPLQPPDSASSWPYQYEQLSLLTAAQKANPQDGQTALELGLLLFRLGKANPGRELWKLAVQLGAEPVLACRALGMAAKTLDGDLNTARQWLEKANNTDPQDPIVARDLATVLSGLAEKAATEEEKRTLVSEARDRLKGALAAGKSRADFVALLARQQNQLGEFAETATLLDTVRVTIWEGGHDVHDLFEQAHFALGNAQLKAGHPGPALTEFNRALEYPPNLATGRLQNAPEAHIQLQRGNALIALDRKNEAREAWRLAADSPESKDPRVQQARQDAKLALEKP